MGDGGANAIARLKKAAVERLLTNYDADPIAALTVALRIVLEMPTAEWASLIAAAPIAAVQRHLLLEGDESILDQLAAELNERRGFVEQ
jgi:hypothetical protein